jgi:hypothetical protein
MGAYESGQAFIAGVLAKLPAEQRAQAEAIFNAAEGKEAVTLIGDGALARSDYSRSMDTLREKEGALQEYYTRLDGWYKDNQTALEQARAGNGNGNGHPNPAPNPNPNPDPNHPNPAPTGVLSAADIRRIADEAVNEAGRDYIAVTAFLATQGARHSHLFSEPLDMTELVNNPKLGKPILGQPGRVYSLADAYQEKYGERLAAKQKEAEDKRFNDEVEKRLQDRIRATPSSHPFPLRQEASPLDALATKDGPAAHTLDTAVAEYERLQQARGA